MLFEPGPNKGTQRKHAPLVDGSWLPADIKGFKAGPSDAVKEAK